MSSTDPFVISNPLEILSRIQSFIEGFTTRYIATQHKCGPGHFTLWPGKYCYCGSCLGVGQPPPPLHKQILTPRIIYRIWSYPFPVLNIMRLPLRKRIKKVFFSRLNLTSSGVYKVTNLMNKSRKVQSNECVYSHRSDILGQEV